MNTLTVVVDMLYILSFDINKVSVENFQHPSRLKTRLAVLSTVFALFSKSKGLRAFISDFASSLATICALGVVYASESTDT